MGVGRQKENWEKLANVDPYWSILVDSSKIDNKWDLDHFYATGSTQIRKVLDFLTENKIKFLKLSALDYGCGAGRLSEAMAESFDHVTGVDFSQTMINVAKAHNKYKNLNYEWTNGENLSNFSTGTFDFIISLITLQHSPSKVQIDLLREMIRVVRDDGVIVVSVVTHIGILNYLRNIANRISPGLTNFILDIWQRAVGRKMGHYDMGTASQMFPVSRKKIERLLIGLRKKYLYLKTNRLSYDANSELEAFIIFSSDNKI